MGASLGSLCFSRDETDTAVRRSRTTFQGRIIDKTNLHNSIPSIAPYEGPNLELPAQWIEECLLNHYICSQNQQPTYRPTRLIDLGSGSNLPRPRLVESSLTDPPVKYLALSYCWGNKMSDAGKTYFSTLTARKAGLVLNTLPKTFVHFFEVAKRLDVRYVWIDALCIIQDSDLDWQRESQRMGQIYSNALCTIAAESSASCHGGLWLESTRNGTHDGIVLMTQEENTRQYLSTTDQRIWRSSLQSRGWTLQERDLSPRVIHFTYAHLFWECRTSRTDCTAFLEGCQGIIESNSSISASGLEWKSSRLRAFDVPRGDEGSSSQLTLRSSVQEHAHCLAVWREIIKDYSGRAFTRQSDRLPALSGLATEVEKVLGSGYVAGLWIKDTPCELLWATMSPPALDLTVWRYNHLIAM